MKKLIFLIALICVMLIGIKGTQYISTQSQIFDRNIFSKKNILIFAGSGVINSLIIELTFVMPAKAGIQEFFELVPGFRRHDD